MADAFIAINEDATIGKRLDAESRTVAGLLVHLERLRVTGAGERYMDVNAASEGLVHDADVLAQLALILTELGQKLEAGQAVALDVATLAALETITTANMIPAVETGLAKEVTLGTVNGKLPDESGVWDYYGGSSGTVIVGAGERVLGIAAIATAAGATVAINGGDAIPVPTDIGVELAPRANLTAPTIVFSGTASYLVEVLI